MHIELNHKFRDRCHDLNALMKDCNKLSTFCARLEKQSTLYPDRYEPELYRGHGLEFFTEPLIKLSPMDNRIGIANYSVVEDGKDIGVDGYGTGIDGKPATVQVKNYSDSTSLLTANGARLTNFTSASVLKYNVDPQTKTNMLIITTAEGLHHFTDNEMFLNKVRCIGHKQLRELVDNNVLFWDAFRNLLDIK